MLLYAFDRAPQQSTIETTRFSCVPAAPVIWISGRLLTDNVSLQPLLMGGGGTIMNTNAQAKRTWRSFVRAPPGRAVLGSRC